MSLEQNKLKNEFIIEFLASGEETILWRLVCFGALNSYVGIYPCK